MKGVGVIMFWALGAVCAVPAILGVALLVISTVLALALWVAAVLAALAVATIACIPIIWLFGTWDGAGAQVVLARIRAQSKAPVAHQ